MDGLQPSTGSSTDELDSSLLDELFTTQGWNGLLDTQGWTHDLFASQETAPGLITTHALHTHTPQTELNLSGLSDIFDEISALGDNKNFGSSLSDQLRDEPGLLEALKDLGFQEQISTGETVIMCTQLMLH